MSAECGRRDTTPYIRIPRQHYATLYVEEDIDTGHILYEEWDAEIARVRLVPFDDSGRSTVYRADLRWQARDEVRVGFLLAAGALTGHTIHRSKTMDQIADAGQVMVSNETIERYAEVLGASRWHGPIRVESDHWELPAGAYKHTMGPT